MAGVDRVREGIEGRMNRCQWMMGQGDWTGTALCTRPNQAR